MKKFYLKERYNPQLGVHYVKCGVMSKSEAKKHEKPLYGDNIMNAFDTEELYNQRIAELIASGYQQSELDGRLLVKIESNE